jgi:hypothetical protein
LNRLFLSNTPSLEPAFAYVGFAYYLGASVLGTAAADVAFS